MARKKKTKQNNKIKEKEKKKRSFMKEDDAFNLKLKLILPEPISDTVLPKIGLHGAATCNACYF